MNKTMQTMQIVMGHLEIVDFGIVLLIVGFLYVTKKFIDKWIR